MFCRRGLRDYVNDCNAAAQAAADIAARLAATAAAASDAANAASQRYHPSRCAWPNLAGSVCPHFADQGLAQSLLCIQDPGPMTSSSAPTTLGCSVMS